MPASPPIRRLRYALLLSLTVLVALLALPAASIARAHKASCHSSATTRSKHARKCSSPAHKTKAGHAAHRPSHAKHKRKAKPVAAAEEAEVLSEAVCEDGSAPEASLEGSPEASMESSFVCADGSAPQCEAGAVPTPSSDGSTLLCEAAVEVATNEEEPES